MAKRKKANLPMRAGNYAGLVGEIAQLLEQSRRTAARTVNGILTATYWEIGRRIVEFEQGGAARADYGAELVKRLATDLTTRFGRGFSKSNLFQMRGLFLGWEIFQTPSGTFEARVRLPPAFEIVLLSRERGDYADEAEGRRSREAASFHSPGCSAAEPWVCDRIESVALKGRHSCAPSDVGSRERAHARRNDALSGLHTVTSARNPGFHPGLWTHAPSGLRRTIVTAGRSVGWALPTTNSRWAMPTLHGPTPVLG